MCGAVPGRGSPAGPSRIDLGPSLDSRREGGDAFERLPQKAKDLLNRYGALERRGLLRPAESGYTDMTTTADPTISAAGAIALGMLRRGRGDIPGALEAFLLAGRSEDPDLFPLGLLYLGHLWVQAGNLSAAAETYYQVVRSRHPNHTPPAAWALSRLVPPAEAAQLRRWVRDSRHPDVSPLAAAEDDNG